MARKRPKKYDSFSDFIAALPPVGTVLRVKATDSLASWGDSTPDKAELDSMTEIGELAWVNEDSLWIVLTQTRQEKFEAGHTGGSVIWIPAIEYIEYNDTDGNLHKMVPTWLERIT